MTLAEWAKKWELPPEALRELVLAWLPQHDHGIAALTPAPEGSEAAAQQQCRLNASKAGVRLWRNNLGSYRDERGNWVRYGLCNDSAKLNAALKSSDLIGIGPGGKFIAREIKRPGWKFKGDEHERAQLAFLQLITGMGGDAKFSTGEWE